MKNELISTQSLNAYKIEHLLHISIIKKEMSKQKIDVLKKLFFTILLIIHLSLLIGFNIINDAIIIIMITLVKYLINDAAIIASPPNTNK